MIRILTGEIKTGKTTTLANWVKNKSNVGGILTPVKNGVRCFYSILDETYFAMQATENDKETLTIGKFVFSVSAFEEASLQLQKCTTNANLKYLIIDEIGPLELIDNLGFYNLLITLLKMNRDWELILVVRLAMLQKMEELLIANQQEFIINRKESFIC